MARRRWVGHGKRRRGAPTLDSPLVIVKNEKQDRRRDIDEAGLRGRFSNLRDVLADNRGLDEVVQRIRQHLGGLAHIGEALPATWKRVREVLEQDARDYISVDEYLRTCADHGFTRHEDKLQLSGYLHDLGICLHFQDDPVLKNTVVLKPKWGTDAVYRVLDHALVIDQKGRFQRSDLEAIWSEPRYAPMRDELLQLMMRFRLCYRLPGAETYIAPQLLGPAQPQYRWPERDGNLVLKYRYEFMPKGIVTQLIVGLHPLITDQSLVWRSGVVLARDGTRCEVVEDYPRREISVRATGDYPREILAIVDHEIGRIHRSFRRLKVDTLVPCQCPDCVRRADPHFYPFEVLRRFARDGQAIQCQRSYQMVVAKGLIESVLPQRSTEPATFAGQDTESIMKIESNEAPADGSGKAVFVSYAWGGESGDLVDALEAAFAGSGVALARDRNEVSYKDSIRAFMQKIGRGKCIVVVISKKYIESRNCMFELTEIAEHGDFRDRIFPIILPDAGIFDALQILEYVHYWEEKIKALDAKMRQVELTNLQGITEEINLYREIRTTVAGIVDVLRDMNVRTVDSHKASGFREIIAAIEAKLADA